MGKNHVGSIDLFPTVCKCASHVANIIVIACKFISFIYMDKQLTCHYQNMASLNKTLSSQTDLNSRINVSQVRFCKTTDKLKPNFSLS